MKPREIVEVVFGNTIGNNKGRLEGKALVQEGARKARLISKKE